jgi:hypothetical protein
MTKQDILSEIKRVASANGGVTPGMASFHKGTGVTYYDWFGIHWSRWGDAIREAGLIPNQMNASYEEDFLIEKLVGLAREIGHFPVKGDIRLKKFKEKEFPNDKTFGRLGSKDQLVTKVADFCRQRSGFGDVIRMCEEASSKTTTNKSPEVGSEQVEKIGIVYLIKSGRFYKIGKTNSIGRRAYDLAIQLAEKPTTVHVIKTDDPDGVETYWHRRFASKRKNGEWFDLNPVDVKAFKKWLRIV